MYEAPPCERPAVKVPQRQVEENVYLGNNAALSHYCTKGRAATGPVQHR